jgi:ABC-type transport system substrate-binding protein
MNQFPGKVTNDPKLRQALMTAVDPQKYADAVFGPGKSIYSPGILVPGMRCYNAKLVKQYTPTPSVDAAKKILSDAGYKLVNGNLQTPDGAPLQFRVVVNAPYAAGGEYLVSVFKQLGIDSTLSSSALTFASDVLGANFDVTNTGSSANPLPNPSVPISLISGPPTKDGGKNRAWTARTDPSLTREARLAMSTVGAESCKHFDAVQQALLQKYYAIGMGAQLVYTFIRKPASVYNLGSGWIEPWSMRKP